MRRTLTLCSFAAPRANSRRSGTARTSASLCLFFSPGSDAGSDGLIRSNRSYNGLSDGWWYERWWWVPDEERDAAEWAAYVESGEDEDWFIANDDEHCSMRWFLADYFDAYDSAGESGASLSLFPCLAGPD